MKKSFFLYTFLLVIFGLGIFLTLERGRREQSEFRSSDLDVFLKPVAGPAVRPALPNSIWSAINGNLREPLVTLFIQLLIILIATRFLGSLFVKIRQPAVVGEMFAGILLGPSLFGLLYPQAFGFIFPGPSLGMLKLLSQVGVCLFMLAVGMELDISQLRRKAPTAVVVSHASILVPYFLGVVVSLVLFPTLAGPGIPFTSFALFMGISMSITAFPVLARILQERGMEKTPLGNTAIACAAVDDVTAWCILALVVALVRSTGMVSALFSLVFVLVFAASMFWIIRPRLSKWFRLERLSGGLPENSIVATALIFTFTAALTTELIGIHALFGAFLAGVVMPSHPQFRNYLKVRIQSFSSIFLLPLFFAFTGLRTQIGLINDLPNWAFCLLIIGVATVGKLGGTMLAARFTGMGWNDSFALGALMNTRGLMELIAINIGYDLGILSSQIFAMLVLMALITTFLTGPLLTFAEFLKRTHPRTASARVTPVG